MPRPVRPCWTAYHGPMLPRFTTLGRGPVLLMLHDVDASHLAFAPQVESFASLGYQAVAWDMPGYGHSPPVEPYDFKGLAARCVALIEALTQRRDGTHHRDQKPVCRTTLFVQRLPHPIQSCTRGMATRTVLSTARACCQNEARFAPEHRPRYGGTSWPQTLARRPRRMPLPTP